MSFLPRVRLVLAVCVFSFALALPLLFVRQPGTESLLLQVEYASDTACRVQVYFDTGQGFSEVGSATADVPAGGSLQPLSFLVPSGTLQAMRFDPADRTARVRLRNPRLVTSRGRTVHAFQLEDFAPAHQIRSLRREGEALQVATIAQANDPMLTVRLPSQLDLQPRISAADFLRRWLPVLGAVCLVLLLARLLPRTLRQRAGAALRATSDSLATRPRLTLALVALLATVASSYPVVFLGRSYVSPNFHDGTNLLYDHIPTLPGYDDPSSEKAQGSDVGAITWQHLPYSIIQHRALARNHEWPLWNRYNACGTVLLGQGQSMFGDPLHLLVIAAGGSAWAWDLKYLLAKWLLGCGLGLTVLHCTRRLAPTLLSAIAAAFLGFFVFRQNHPAFFSFCYTPWILYAWARLADVRSWRGAVAGCLGLVLANACELNSGTVKEAYLLLFGMNFCGAATVLFAARPWRERAGLLAGASWAGVTFALLTAPSWVTFLDSLKQAYTNYDAPAAFQLPPWFALGFFDELFYRPLLQENRVFNPAANFLVLGGVLYFLAAGGRTASRTVKVLAGSALVPAALAFGLVPAHWITAVPFLGNVVHIDNCLSCVLILVAVVVAGAGWQAAIERLPTPDGQRDLLRAAGGYAVVVYLWIAFVQTLPRATFGDHLTFTFAQSLHRIPVPAFVWGSLAALTAALAVLLLTLRRVIRSGHIDLAGSLLLAAAVQVLVWREAAHAPAVGPDAYVFNPGRRVDFAARSSAVEALRADIHEPGRAVGLGNNLFPGWSSAYDIEGISGADAVVNREYRELVQALGLRVIWLWRIYVTPDTLAANKPALDFLNVRHYVDFRSDQAKLGASLTLVKAADLDVYRSSGTWPRAFFVREVGTYEEPDELAAAIRAGGGPFAAIQTSDAPAQRQLAAIVRPDVKPSPARAAREYQLTTNATSFTVDADGPGIAVLHEAWLKRDFVATVDGKPAECVRINHAFKGVAIPAAGVHRITFTYRPRRFSSSLALSAVGAVLLLGSSAWAWRQDPMDPRSPA